MYTGRTPPPRRKPEPPRVAPLPAEMLDQFRNKPLGGGEFTPIPEPAPPAPVLRGLEIEKPDWEKELAERAVDPPTDSPLDGLTAVERMKVNSEPYEPDTIPGPPEVLGPLPRFVVPEVDWREEAEERARRTTAENQELLEPTEPTRPTYPMRPKP